MKETISIIVPVYKVEKYIDKCLNSILNQTYPDLEIILVDDGSPDNCGKICDEYEKKDKRIKVIHKKNGGQSEARNEGLKIATGKYIGFVDSDDYIKENMFEILYKNIINYGADISIGNIIKIEKNKNIIIENYDNVEIFDKSDSLKQLLKQHITNYTFNKLYKRHLWNNIKFPVGKLLEDMDIMYHILEKSNKVVCTNQTEYYYLIRKDSSIAKIDEKITYTLKDCVNKRYQYLINIQPDLLDLLNIDKMLNIIQCFYNLSYCSRKDLYNNKDFLIEYQFYHDNFKKYKKELYKGKSCRKKYEMFLLYVSRTLYYYYCKMKTILKYKLRKEKQK